MTIAIADGIRADGDRRLLRVVLENLLANAWKYSAPRDVARIEFAATGEASSIFFVRDNGVGFDMELAPHLFRQFARLHGGPQFDGIGIGLATVKRIVQRHGGRIWAEARAEAGATFFFSLREGAEREPSPGAGCEEDPGPAAT